jgi:hypothetical protein
MRFGAVVALAGVLAGLLGWSPVATGSPWAARTIDRTLACSTLRGADGRRAVGIGAAPRSQYNKAMLGVFLFGRTEADNRPLVHVFAPGPGGPTGRHGMWIDRSICRVVRPAFRLSPVGLTGALTDEFAEKPCEAGRTVLLRVRVSFDPWRGWRRLVDPPGPPRLPTVDYARGRPTAASIVVRSGGRPLAYAMFDGSGKTRIVTARPPRCEA